MRFHKQIIFFIPGSYQYPPTAIESNNMTKHVAKQHGHKVKHHMTAPDL